MNAGALEFRMLGGLEVRRGEARLELPPSKKTRALLAYLVLSARSHRRDALCSLLWDVTDDPRGALRWSLSKLRKQVDDPDVKRITSDKEHVAFEAHGAHIDVLAMREALERRTLSEVPVETLESWCRRCLGEVLEGLDLPDFDTYQAWLVAEREQTRRLRASVLGELVARHEAAPERALGFAVSWSQVDPMNAAARVAVMRLALASGQKGEAKRQYQSAQRVFAELDPEKERQLTAQWHALRTAKSTGAPAESEAPPSRPMPIGHSATLELSRKLATSLPLAGRDHERRDLFQALSEVVRTRRAQLLLLTGEPGIGKTRLVDELLLEARQQQYAVLDGSAYEGESGRPYGPWIDALHRLPQDRFEPSARAKLAPLLEGTSDTETRTREVLFSGVVEVLTHLAATRAPVVVALDDVHWLDEGSAELLHYTARMQRGQPVLFVLTARTAELYDSRALLRVLRSLRRDVEQREIALYPLTAQATQELVHHVNGRLNADEVHAQSGGNPLFALELARSGVESPERARTVTDAVRDRLDQVPEEAVNLLRWGAVLGTAFDMRQLATLSSLNPEQQLMALEELERHALLRHEEGRYEFSHALVRQVVYDDLSQPRRLLMHRRAAEALSALLKGEPGMVDEDIVADIARHASVAGDHATAASAYLAAGRRCVRLSAGENAATLARRGLRHAVELSEPARAETLLELMDVQLWAKRPSDVDAFCTEVQKLSELALQQGSVKHARLGFNMLSYVRWETGEWNEARKQMLKAEQAVRYGDEADHVEALAEAARCLSLLEQDMSYAGALVAEADARSKALDGQSFTLADARGGLFRHLGEFDAADTSFEQSALLARAANQSYAETQALIGRCELAYDRGHYDRALEHAEALWELAKRTREGSERPYASVLLALCQLALAPEANWDGLEAALDAMRAADAKHRLIFALTRAAMLACERGDPERTLALATEALESARLLERASEIVLSLVALSRAHALRGEQETSERLQREAHDPALNTLSAHARHVREQSVQE